MYFSVEVEFKYKKTQFHYSKIIIEDSLIKCARKVAYEFVRELKKTNTVSMKQIFKTGFSRLYVRSPRI